MGIAPLCIIQARYNSTRLPGKMLLTLGGETLLARAVRIATQAFGKENVVVAYPGTEENDPIKVECEKIGATAFPYFGDERDVLGRFFECAHRFRWHPGSVIVRYTPDDHRKSVGGLRRVAGGERLPVEIGGEAFTLAQLDEANRDILVPLMREHITLALFPTYPPECPDECWTIDTPDQYEEAKRTVAIPVRLDNWMECTPLTTGDLSDPQMGELHNPFDGGPWSPC